MSTDRELLCLQTKMAARQVRLTRRRVMQLAVGTAAATSLGSIGARAETRGPGWYSDEKLTGRVRLITFTGQRWELPSRGVIPTFKERFPNVEVEIQALPFSDLFTKLQLLAASKADSFDAAWGDAGQWQALGAIGAMQNMEPWLAKDPGWWEDYINDVPESITRLYRIPSEPDGDTYGLSSDGNTKLQFYRRDLFEEAGITSVPEVWEEAIEVAKMLHRPEKDQFGFITTARRGLFAGLEFHQLLISYGGDWFDKEGEGGWHPQFDNDFGFQALTTLQKLMEYRHPVTLNAADDEVNAALANGTAVYAPMEWGTTILNDPEFTEFHDVFASDLPPKGETQESRHLVLRGGHAQYINANATSDQDAAFEYIKHLNSGDYVDSRIGADYVAAAGSPARISLLEKHLNVRPHFFGLSKALPVSRSYVPGIPEAFTLADIIGNEVVAVITGEKPIEDALRTMEKGVTQVMTDSGYYG